MIEAVAVSANPVKSQQLGEPDLTLEERRAALLEQYRSKPLVFLERYQAHLKPEHLGAFAHLSADCRTQYYSEEVRRRASSQASKTSVKNHRYAALRALQQGEGHELCCQGNQPTSLYNQKGSLLINSFKTDYQLVIWNSIYWTSNGTIRMRNIIII